MVSAELSENLLSGGDAAPMDPEQGKDEPEPAKPRQLVSRGWMYAAIALMLVAAGLLAGVVVVAVDRGSSPSPSPYPDLPTPAEGLNPVARAIKIMERVDWRDILQSQQPDGTWVPSLVYKSPDLITAADKMLETGIGDYKLIGGDYQYILVNIAAFLAQSMLETIQYDACDEFNWDKTSGYTSANACGQLGQSYQDYKCSSEEEHMACAVDPQMEILGTTNRKWHGAPPPFFCGPKFKVPAAPKWNTGNPTCPSTTTFTPWSNPDEYFTYLSSGETCKDYEGQKAGSWQACTGGCPNAEAPVFGQPARRDVEGCCWWGRGVIHTTGVCNIGKLNYYAGKRAATENRPSLFPDVDFCKTPEAICASTDHPDLKWIAGLFYWAKEVQAYPSDKYNFNYEAELRAFTDAGNMNDNSFIDKISGIVNRGCPSLSDCPAGRVSYASERAANFQAVLKAFGFPFIDRQLLALLQRLKGEGY